MCFSAVPLAPPRALRERQVELDLLTALNGQRLLAACGLPPAGSLPRQRVPTNLTGIRRSSRNGFQTGGEPIMRRSRPALAATFFIWSAAVALGQSTGSIETAAAQFPGPVWPHKAPAEA